jgi:diguanylate cyclase (GGDEF)-like protein/PAS domain S-box-containing protein
MLPDHLPLLLDHCLAGLYVLSGERIVWLNARAAEMVGCTVGELVGGSFLEFIYPPDLPMVRSKAQGGGPYVVRAVRRDGQLVYLEVHQRGLEKDGQRLISGAVLDVTARVQGEAAEREKLLHDAFHDALTGLPNRALFLDRLEHRLALEKRRHQSSFSVLVLDIDRFKVINDSLGHVRGDELLVEVARRLQSCLRPADTVARLSGDEFTILLEDVASAADARNVADRLREELRVPFWLGAHEVFSGASIGIAHGSAAYAHPEDILRDADTALYRAKAQGRGRCVEFDASMHDRAVELLELETSLRRALERQEFHLHYQPVVSLSSGQITGAEALLRWKHPERGLVPPMEFIPLAEETGLIVEIGAWVLRGACRQMKEWQERLGQPQLEIGVNLSSRQFQGPGLVAEVAEVLRATGLAPRSLRLEVTESLLMDKHPNVAQTMTELRAMGVRIDLDDFGTGYSSLSYLHQFPIDTLKIDRSFIHRIGASDDAVEIVNTILALASSLDMEVVAEGVETEQQLQQLRKMHCAYAQGYHLSRPIEASQFETLIGTGRSWAA